MASKHPYISSKWPPLAAWRVIAFTWLMILPIGAGLHAAPAKVAFDLPADSLEKSVKRFAVQSGLEVIIPSDELADVRTRAVNGEMTSREALDAMLAGTGVQVFEDPRTGAFALRKETSDPNGSRAAPAKPGRRPDVPSTPTTHLAREPDNTMKRKTPISLLLGLLTLGLAGENPALAADAASGSTASQSGTGTVRGQVSNQATGSNLESATVRIIELNRVIHTEGDGTFEASGLAPGSYTLAVSYPGLDPKRETVTVQAGQTARLKVELNSDIYVLPEMVVAGQREGNAAAIAEQRVATNVKNVITADAFGDITKANIANILRRIPGVTGITDDEIDTSVIMVRGMEAYLTSVDVDGTKVPSTFTGSRRQNVNAIPADLVEKIEVVKATTADEDADSLGGRVKLTTKSAFDLGERRIDLRLGGSYNGTWGKKVTPDGKDYIPLSASLLYSNTFDVGGKPDSLGILASVNFDRFLDARANTDFPLVNEELDDPDEDEPFYAVFENASAELHEQIRKGANLRVDYRLGDNTVLGVRGTFTSYQDDLVRSRNQIDGGEVDTALSDPDFYYTVVEDAVYAAQKYQRERTTDTTTFRFNGVTTLDSSKLSYDFTYSKGDQIDWRNTADFVSNEEFTYALDRRSNKEYPAIITLSGQDPFQDRFEDTDSTDLERRRQKNVTKVWSSRVDYTKDFDWQLPFRLKTGVRYREEYRVEDQDRFLAEVNGDLGDDLSGFLDTNWNVGGAEDRYPVGALPSFDRLLGNNVQWVGGADPRTQWTYDPDVLEIDNTNTIRQSLLNDRKLSELLYAGYVQGELKWNKLDVVGGVRFESTDLSTVAGIRNRGVSDPLLAHSGRFRTTASYDDWFPSVHLTYNITDNLLVRAAWSTTIGRPDVDELSDSTDINLGSRSITMGNSNLQPQYSDNYDVSLEYYFKEMGVISVGVFQKDIKDYIAEVQTTISAVEAAELGAPLANPLPTDPTWRLNSTVNSGDADVKGLEFAYSQQLSFLPGAFRGLGVFANYTWISSEGRRQAGGVTPLQNFIPRTGNVGLSYTYGRWDARMQVGYNSSFLDNLADDRYWDQYKGERYQLDLNGRYKVTRNLAIFANLSNLTSENYGEYRGSESPERREGTTGYSFIATAGINLTF